MRRTYFRNGRVTRSRIEGLINNRFMSVRQISNRTLLANNTIYNTVSELRFRGYGNANSNVIVTVLCNGEANYMLVNRSQIRAMLDRNFTGHRRINGRYLTWNADYRRAVAA